MKITGVEIIAVGVPMGFSYGEIGSVPAVVARLQTDQGLEGLGHAFTLMGRGRRSLVAAAEELGELLIGEDPRRPERIHRKMLPDGQGSGGVGNIAASVLDIAVWDLAAKAADLPLYRLLGGHRDRIPAYASLRLGRTVSTAQLPEAARTLLAQGFKAMKMNLGGESTVAAELARVRAVRDTIGPEIRLLADVNSRWTPAQAGRIGHLIDELGLFWLEDPVPTHNLEGLKEVRSAIDTPVATGETLYGLSAFRALFEARAVDIPMPDLVRVGGITAFLKIAHLAEAFGLPLACHLLPEISAHVVAAVPNGLIVEGVPWGWQLFRNAPELKDGDFVLHDRPGTGLELDLEFVSEHRLD